MYTNLLKSFVRPIAGITLLSTTGASLLYCASPSSSSSSSASFTPSSSTTSSSFGTLSSSRPTFDPCPEIACKSKEELAALFGERKSALPRRLPSATTATSSSDHSSSSSSSFSSTSSSSSTQTSTVSPDSKNNINKGYALACPPDREELGYHSWNLLHTIAAYYPDNPTPQDKEAAEGLIKALTYLYPCKHCRTLWQQDTSELPPKYGNRTEFALWFCEQHNRVNTSLGKPTFPCSIETLDQRWRTGRPECWGGSTVGSTNTLRQTASESLGQNDEAEAE